MFQQKLNLIEHINSSPSQPRPRTELRMHFQHVKMADIYKNITNWPAMFHLDYITIHYCMIN